MATTELEPSRPALAPARPVDWLRPRAAAALRIARTLRRADLAALLVLIGGALLVHWPTVVGVGVYARDDTITFFYPVFATLHQSLRAGELPLWTPYIFGGFPLFAEGQVGALYPPALLAALLPSPIDGFFALRVFHVAVAVVGTYVFARSLGTSPLGGVVGGLVFGLGSFIVSQQHHASLLAAAAWLPLVLACVELALSRASRASHGYLALAGCILGMQALASHVQPVMLTGGLLLLYVPARQVAMLRPRWAVARSRAERRQAAGAAALLGLWAAVAVPLLGAAIAAVQLLPLYELSRESWRAQGWSYADAIEYSLPPINFLTLLFPFFFRAADGGQWSLWQAWEVVLYVGVVPLLLALLALVAVRRWFVLFFGLVAAASGFLALGGYAPFQLYERLWSVPGMALQRAPARFTLLTTLALAVLAAQGVDWLARRRVDGSADRHSRHLLVMQVGVLVGLAALVGHLVIWRAWLHADQAWALRVLSDWYLRLPHDPLQALSPLKVYGGLDAALDLGNPKTALPLVLLLLCALLLVGWRELPRLAPAWQVCLVWLVAVDLIAFSIDFHPLVSGQHLADRGDAGDFLASNAGAWRSLTRPEVEATRPNQLLPARAAEVAGYSPLALYRHRWFESAVNTVDNTLLDLWGVRYVVTPADSLRLPSYDQVGYHPRRPLMIGGAATPNGRLELDVPADPATQLRMIAALAEGAAIPDGEVVGEWLLTDVQGVRRVVPVRAGREIADRTIGQPGARTAHRPVQVATSAPIAGPNEGGERPVTLSYAAVRLPQRQILERVEYRHVHPVGRTILYGLALYDSQTESIGQFYLPSKYAVAYRDAETVIYENRSYVPRAVVVPDAVAVPDGVSAQDRLLHGPFDPLRQVVVESSGAPTGTGSVSVAGQAEVVHDGSQLVTVRATAPAGGYLVLSDPYYPGWRAFVDGEEVELFRANYLFRAVALPSGEHDVTFVFDPSSFRLGATISAAGLGAAALLVVAALAGPALVRRLRHRQTV
jgi:hypothetical protein